MIAVSQRYLQRIPQAFATLADLEKLHPGYSRLFQSAAIATWRSDQRLRPSRRSCGRSI